jgi:hypothetical protein
MQNFKYIKTSLAAAAILAVSISAGAQNKDFEKIAELDDVQYVYISESMLKNAALRDSPLIKAALNSGSLESLEILTCDTSEAHDKTLEMLRPSLKDLKLMSKIKEESKNIDIFCEKDGNRYSRLLILTRGHAKDQLSVVYLTGDFDLEILKSIHTQQTK